jgi:hypothetical protein
MTDGAGGTPAAVASSTTTSSEPPTDAGISSTAVAPSAPDATTSTTQPSRAEITLGAARDGAGDGGLGGAGYADLVGVELRSTGSTLVAYVTFAAPLPARLPEGEVEGVGVDIFTRSAPPDQSDWQLFADGGPDGWFGYLDGPDGAVDLPGSLVIDGATLRFEIGWTELGGPTAGSFSCFADWVRDGTPLNTVSEDHAPQGGSAGFDAPG